MKNLNPYFTIGTVGMIVVSIVHIALALIFKIPLLNTLIYILYPVAAAFMAIGYTRQAEENQKKLIPIRVKK